MTRLYRYVGPAEIAQAVTGGPGVPIRSAADVAAWVRSQGDVTTAIATFVVDSARVLRLAPRRSEHVACAGGGPVYAAGELTATDSGEIVDVSNQSTGFCPEPACWSAIERALDEAGVSHPGALTAAFVFRRCESCGQRCIVKDDWFECDVCEAALPADWNF